MTNNRLEAFIDKYQKLGELEVYPPHLLLYKGRYILITQGYLFIDIKDPKNASGFSKDALSFYMDFLSIIGD